MLLRLSLIAPLFALAVQASNVLDLDSTNFDDIIGKGKPALVEFFAPWCGHCKNLAPTYEQLADAYSHVKDKVIIAKVDADAAANKPVAQKYGVTGFPTLKWFGPEGGDPETYSEARDLEALANFITTKSGVKSNIKPPPPGATLILDANTFDEVVFNTSKNVLVAFTAPWCGHCKRMKPIYETVAQTFESESECVLANVDADAKKNMPLAMKYEISSFPTLVFFSKEDKKGVPYTGAREEKDFVDFLNEKCGTQRAVGGGLNEQAGRVPEFDELAAKFYSASADARQSILDEAITLSKTAGAAAQQYIKVMKKVVSDTEAYLTKETTRLSSILSKRTLSSAKLDEIKTKANILAAFAEKKAEETKEEFEDIAEEAAENAENVAQRLKGEL
ncbi:protein disulfide isomerase [Schizopora paradoxa]|uniref:protein disulfide-isomerase n=1 Tax=Schizopora paradoxa TaxID=27342 RepID=A0A0H2SJC6_9AGAM|nr:protein disulfide isomerase [Schizopora paradoxa]